MDLVCSIQLDFCDNTLVNGTREYISSVVVSMFSDKIDSTGRCEHLSVSTIQDFELVLNSGFHFHNLYVV